MNIEINFDLNSRCTRTRYIHDHADRIIAEIDASGATIREYVWLDDLPVAVIEGATLLFVQADHLGRPVAMYDGAQAKVWAAHYEPFGTAHSITGPAANDNRFPGQLFQLESGLAYNWHRHYDATTGRYTQADPLGVSRHLALPNLWKAKHEPKQPAPNEAKVDVDLKSSAFLIEVAAERARAASPILKPGAGKDGPAIYNYARQRPMQEKDPTGLLTDSGGFTPMPKGGAEKCAANDNMRGNWCFGTPISIDSWGSITCRYRCTDGMVFTNNFGTMIGGQMLCPRLPGN